MVTAAVSWSIAKAGAATSAASVARPAMLLLVDMVFLLFAHRRHQRRRCATGRRRADRPACAIAHAYARAGRRIFAMCRNFQAMRRVIFCRDSKLAGNAPLTIARATHSGLIAAWRITLAHLSTSSAMNFVYSAGVATTGSTPRLASFALNSALASAALVSWLSRCTISGGILLGAASPYQ